ncbi:hypothetical protein [Stygiolobus sp. CP8521M]|uniref:hypothetical protein n=1 Tax=Stygiolobus sp. CP8521M TaxID=3133136 RepID=UPI00307D4F5F
MQSFSDLDKDLKSMCDIIDLLEFDRNLILNEIEKLMEDLDDIKRKRPDTIKQLSRYTKFMEKLIRIIEVPDVRNILEKKENIEELIVKPNVLAEIKREISPILLLFRGIYEESINVNNLVHKVESECCSITCKKNNTFICFCCKTNSKSVIKLCGDLRHSAWERGTRDLLKESEDLLKNLNKNFEINKHFDEIFTAFRNLYDISSKIAHGIIVEDNAEGKEVWNAISKHEYFRKFFDNLLFFALISLNHKVTQIASVNS